MRICRNIPRDTVFLGKNKIKYAIYLTFEKEVYE